MRVRALSPEATLDTACCPLARIAWGLLPEGMRERLAGLDAEVADKELDDTASLLEDARARGR